MDHAAKVLPAIFVEPGVDRNKVANGESRSNVLHAMRVISTRLEHGFNNVSRTRAQRQISTCPELDFPIKRNAVQHESDEAR